MTKEEWEIQKTKLAERVWKHLPVVEMCGWNGDPSGYMPYFDWRKDRDLFLALIDLSSAKTVAKREAIRAEIKTMFYGGEEGFNKFSISCMKQLPDITKPPPALADEGL